MYEHLGFRLREPVRRGEQWPLLQGVAKNFREIFAELAPGGKGELVMQKANPPEPRADSEEAAADPSSRSYDRYSGVKVKVRHPKACRSPQVKLTA